MSSSDFRDTLVELIDTSPEPMDHPSPDQWIAYHRGELADDEEARLHEHLVRCRDCFELAGAAAAFAQPEEEPSAGEEMETAALWRLLRPQLDPPPAPSPENVREISAGPRARPSWRFRLPSTLAAVFFVGLVGLSAWNVSLQSTVKALKAPQPNVPIVEFSPGERLPIFTGTPEKTLSAPGPWMLMLHPIDELPVYRLTLRDAATDRELGSYEERLNANLALTLHLPDLPPGRYRLELSDGSGGRKGRTIETHLVEVKGMGQGG
jgi:hypothetical protein